jgi:LysR family transcriptional regulator, hypochlorite-specific transcription factor HypT
MELKWLEDFVAVAGTGNFSRAAEARNVTQPAFSRRLKALETWVGVPLLDRSNYPITLTPAGEKLLAVAERAVRDLRAAREEARATTVNSAKAIKFAMPHSLAVDFFPVWWPTIHKAGKLAKPLLAKVVADNLHDCVELLLQGGCHFLLCYRSKYVPDPSLAANFRGMAIGVDVLMPVCAAMADGSPLHGPSSKPVPMLGYAPDAFLGKVTSGLLNAARERPAFMLAYESAYAEALRAQTLAGEGVAWLPKRLIEADLNAGRLVRAGPQLPEAHLDIWLYSASFATLPAIEALWSAAAAIANADMT